MQELTQEITQHLSDPALVETALVWAGRALVALLIFLVGRWIGRLVGRWTRGMLERARLDETLAQFGGSAASVVVTIVALIAALTHLGVEVTSLIAVLGAATLAIGLAMRDSLSNFAAGAMLMTYRPFGNGDFVEAGGMLGVVEQIGMFHTRMRTTDNREITVPNSRIYGEVITNYTARKTRRIDLDIGISYDDDIQKAKKLLAKIVEQDERLHREPAPIIWVSDLGDSSVDLSLKVWTDTEIFWDVRSDLIEKIKRIFDNYGITIPFPQRDVHLRQDEAKQAESSQ